MGMKLIIKTKRKRKSDKAWLMLVGLSVFVFLCALFLSFHLPSPLRNDLPNFHLLEFQSENIQREISKPAAAFNSSASSKVFPSLSSPRKSLNPFVDPYYVDNVPPSDGTNLWDDDSHLPDWAKAYFNWHKHKRKTWNLVNYTSERWLIMQCLADQDKRKCGGTADRLKPVPFMLRMAYNSHRILLIRWTRPAMFFPW